MNGVLINLLSEEETNRAHSTLYSLKNEWRGMTDGDANMPYSILGATSYSDARTNVNLYYKLKKYYNPLLLNNFSWLYDKIIKTIQGYIGPCALEENLAYPGFHIMSSPQKDAERHLINFGTDYINKRHQDHIYNYHLDLLQSKYSEVNLENNYSFTLSLELPRNGSGLVVWSGGEFKKYSGNDKFIKDIEERNFYVSEDIVEPDIVSYRVGGLFLFSGNLFHQVPPIFEYYGYDNRITLQGHSVMCDGIWRLYF